MASSIINTYAKRIPPLPSPTSQCLRRSRQATQYSIATAPRRFFSQSPWHRQRYTISFGVPSGGLTRIQKLRETARENPYSFTLAMICLAISISGIVYANYWYVTYIVGAFKGFPEEVATPLRKAIYFDNHGNDPQRALRYYQDALREAAAVGMDPWSDEIIGLKIRFAAFLEKHGVLELSAKVLDSLRRGALEWVDKRGDEHFGDGRRTAILSKTVAIGVKLGELYSSPAVNQPELAEESLISAVETILQEKRRREVNGVKEGEGEWDTDDQQAGGSMEALAHHYESANRHYLATPLFLQALTLCPPRSCHRVVLMNNVAMSLAQQRPPTSWVGKDEKLASPEVLRQQAIMWAQKALQLAADIKSPDRTEECDRGCAVVTHNLGELAEMAGNIEEAKKRYKEAQNLAEGIGFIEGVQESKAALKRLETSTS